MLVDASSNAHPGLWKALAPIAASLNLHLAQVQAGGLLSAETVIP